MTEPRCDPVKSAFKAGYDCAVHGANTSNCHLSLFATPELTKEWERGKQEGEKTKVKP